MRWDWRPPVGFLAGCAFCLAGGLTVVSSALVGLLVAAVVLLGGLLTTALVALFLLPSTYQHTGPHPANRPFGGPEAHRIEGSAA